MTDCRVKMLSPDDAKAAAAQADQTKACAERFGQNSTIELVTAVGCWQLVSKLARSLAIPLEAGIESWPPDGRRPK